MTDKHRENATIRAYVVGFLLSLVFTFIPYYLVVNQVVTGMALLMTILGFGVLQMLVQVIFFLHIGRGPRPNWQLVFLVVTVGAILVVVGGSVVITNNLHKNMKPTDQAKKLVDDEAIYQIGGEKTGACNGQYENHQVIIKEGKVSPLITVAKKCDTLSFINQDDDTRAIVFGIHPEHITYAGEDQYIVRKDHSKTITLSETGTYKFHDYLQKETAGEFTVSP